MSIRPSARTVGASRWSEAPTRSAAEPTTRVSAVSRTTNGAAADRNARARMETLLLSGVNESSAAALGFRVSPICSRYERARWLHQPERRKGRHPGRVTALSLPKR